MSRAPQRSEQRAPQRLQIRTAGNRYDLDDRRRPAGMTYEWKRKTTAGAEDIEHQVNLEANGWVPVPAERHPELTGVRFQTGKEIVRGGLMLMERPEEVTEEARELDGFAARMQVTHQVQRLGLAGHRAAGKGLKRTYAPPPDAIVPDDDE